ncbi:MAG: peptide chain release factor-like protein [Candidatus Peribacteraceae bacterium]|jgi:protein subunit release factor B
MPSSIELPSDYQQKVRELNIRPEDVEENFIRGSGHGGQKVNKTESTVQLVHHPSGIVVRSQRFREQHLNRIDAWKLLILKLEEKVKGKESALQQEIYKIRKQKARRSKKAKEKMLKEKKLRGGLKELRKDVGDRIS